MTLLVTVLDVIESMGMNPGLEEELTPVISSAIEKAMLMVESEIGSGLQIGSSSETFFTDPDLFCGLVPNGMLSLRLRHKFVRATPAAPTVVTRATYPATATPVEDTLYWVNSDEGVLSLSSDYKNLYVTVAYMYGYESPDELDPAIKQALLALAPMIFRSSQVTTEAGSAPSSAASLELAQSMLNRFRTHPGFQYRPIMHTAT